MTRILHASCLSLEGAQTAPGLSDWEGVVSQGGIHRWGWGALCDDASVRGVRTTEQPELHMNHLELLAVFLALRHFCSEGPACPSDDRQFNSGLLHKQAGRDTLSSLLKLSRSLLLWRSVNFLSLRATHVPGHLNLGPDLPSRGCPLVRDWRLHPFTVAQIWDLFGKTKLHLCASWYNTRLPCYAAWLGEERLSKSGSL